MLIPNNNLAFVAYKTGYCGSLIYALISMSQEVCPYCEFGNLTFNDGTAHEVAERWIPKLHDYTGSVDFVPENWESYLTPEIKEALQGEKLIVVRGHPNTAFKLSFIENLKVIYVTTNNKYQFERWAYEKVYKNQGEQYYINDFQQLTKSNKIKTVGNRIKRHLLIRNFNHDVKSYEECTQVLKTTPHQFDLDRLLENDYSTYTDLCKYLNISPMRSEQLTDIITRYNSKQWNRF